MDNNIFRCRNTFMVTAEGIDDEEEIKVNAAKDNQNVENNDQMGQILAMIRIMQERVTKMDRKLQEKINSKKKQ